MGGQKTKKSFIPAVVMLLLLMMTVFQSTGCEKEETSSTGITVAVTLLPQADIVENVAGDRANVIVMVPPGADPHTYEVTPAQMVELSKAKIYAKVGTPVEFELTWMERFISTNPDMLVIDCSTGIDLLETDEETEDTGDHEHEQFDPHIWLSARNVTVMARNVCDGLVQVDPENRDYYEQNYEEYAARLSEVDKRISAELAGLQNRSFIIYHPTLGYFARDYNLQQIAVEQGGKEPDAEYIVRLVEEAKAKDIKVVFISPEYSTRSAEVIAGEIGGRVRIIDPLAKDIIGNLETITAELKESLE